MTEPCKVLIVDDEYSITASMSFFFNSAGFETAVAVNGVDALEKVASFKPDLIILDIVMPRMDGREVLRRLRQANDWTPVIMLTRVGEAADRAVALNEGADDYINKPADFVELLARVHALLRRTRASRPATTAVLVCGELRFDCSSRDVYLGSEKLKLPPKAVEVLEFFMRNPNQVISRARLLDEIWGWDYVSGERAVDNQVYLLRQALKDDSNKPRYIKTVPMKGYLFLGTVEVE